jgi:hypothetical protein
LSSLILGKALYQTQNFIPAIIPALDIIMPSVAILGRHTATNPLLKLANSGYDQPQTHNLGKCVVCNGHIIVLRVTQVLQRFY